MRSPFRKRTEKEKEENEVKLLMQELKENPIQNFEAAFALMTIIPFLAFIYLLVARLFTFDILVGDIALVLFICITLSLCGFFLGYKAIKRLINRIVEFATKAKKDDQLKSKFVSTVSHDLRNPLFVLDATITDLVDGWGGELSEDQAKSLGVCQGVVDRMGKLVNNLLDMYKIEAGMVKLNKKACNFTNILDKQIKELDVMIQKKNIKLTKDFQKKDLLFNADENMITQVINNIVSNAIKFTPEEGSIGLKLFLSEGFVRLECMDSGESIPPEKLRMVFDKFERLDAKKQGSGLGLAITKDIVEMHNGKIWAESYPKKGNKFVVVLPQE